MGIMSHILLQEGSGMMLGRNTTANASVSHCANIGFLFTYAVRYFAYCIFYYCGNFVFPQRARALIF